MFSYSDNEEYFYGQCETMEAAVSEALDDYPEADTIYVGEAIQRTIGEYFSCYDAESLLEQLAESASEECGDVAQSWLQGPMCPKIPSNIPRAEQEMIRDAWKQNKASYLESLLAKIRPALEEWATENNEQPGFWHVGNVKPFSREEAEVLCSLSGGRPLHNNSPKQK